MNSGALIDLLELCTGESEHQKLIEMLAMDAIHSIQSSTLIVMDCGIRMAKMLCKDHVESEVQL